MTQEAGALEQSIAAGISRMANLGFQAPLSKGVYASSLSKQGILKPQITSEEVFAHKPCADLVYVLNVFGFTHTLATGILYKALCMCCAWQREVSCNWRFLSGMWAVASVEKCDSHFSTDFSDKTPFPFKLSCSSGSSAGICFCFGLGFRKNWNIYSSPCSGSMECTWCSYLSGIIPVFKTFCHHIWMACFI